MKCTLENILTMLKNKSGVKDIVPDEDIFGDVGLIGDDFHEMMEEYAKKYSVDMSTYLWYFHANEEGSGGLGQMLFAPPYRQVKRIPITPLMLVDFANQGKWNINYPETKVKNLKRYDLLINTIVFLAFVGAVLVYVGFKFFGHK
jgi:hypothetical protein